MPGKGALAGEQEINSLERAPGRLGEEAVDDWDVGEHGGAEDVKRLLADAVEHDGHEQRTAAEPDRPARDAEGVALRP